MENINMGSVSGSETLSRLLDERNKHAKRHAELRGRTKGIIAEKFHSAPFLIVAIMITVIAVINLVAVVNDLINNTGLPMISSLIGNAISAICAIVAAVVSWKMYAARDSLNAGTTKGAAAYIVLMAVAGVLMCILAVIAAIILVMLAAALGETGGLTAEMIAQIEQILAESGTEVTPEISDLLHSIDASVMITLVVVAAVLVVFAICYTLTFTKASKHLRFLRSAIASESYNTLHKAPYVLSFIFGGLTVIGGFGGFVISCSCRGTRSCP